MEPIETDLPHVTQDEVDNRMEPIETDRPHVTQGEVDNHSTRPPQSAFSIC